MQSFLLIAITFLLASYAAADQRFLSAKANLETMQKNNEAHILVPSRNMQLRLYPQPTACVALVLHGLFQSPKDMQGLINHFYERGCNVVAPLLKGHWSKDAEAFYKIDFEMWKGQVSEVLSAAQFLGDKIILVGHSTGGLLALEKLINGPQYNFSEAILFAPAIKLQTSVSFSSWVGAFFRMDQNRAFSSGVSGSSGGSLASGNSTGNGKSAAIDEYSLQSRPAIAGVHVQKLIENVFGLSQKDRLRAYSKIRIPLLLISTENDSTVQHSEIINLKNANPNLFKLVAYSKTSSLKHDNIQRSSIDVEINSPKEWVNPHYENLLKQIDNFVN